MSRTWDPAMIDLADLPFRQRSAGPGRAASGVSSGAASGRRIDAFGPNPGQLGLWRYAPATARAGAPLVVVLHGCTQTAEAFAEQSGWLALADREGFVVLAPEQTPANNLNLCFNWFQREDTTRGEGEAASIAAMIAHTLTELDLDRTRVYVVGLSAGGAMAAALLAGYPELFAGAAIIAGLPYAAADTLGDALRAMRHPDPAAHDRRVARLTAAAPAAGRPLRLSLWHGDADPVVHVGNAQAIADQWAAAGRLERDPAPRPAPAGVTRSVWRAPGGDGQIELNLVAGMRHGVPLATAGPDGLGRAGPFMLEAGVSSTLEIARFWGLLGPDARAAAGEGSGAADRPRPSRGLGAKVMGLVSPHVPAEAADAVARALRLAGLLD